MDDSLIFVRKAIARVSLVPLSLFFCISIALETIVFAIWYFVLFIAAIFGNVESFRNSWIHQYPRLWVYFRKICTNLDNWRTDLNRDKDYFNLTKLDESDSIIHGVIVVISTILVVITFISFTFILIGGWAIFFAVLIAILFGVVFTIEDIDKNKIKIKIKVSNDEEGSENK